LFHDLLRFDALPAWKKAFQFILCRNEERMIGAHDRVDISDTQRARNSFPYDFFDFELLAVRIPTLVAEW
jgi:hypothetical protein